MAQPCKSVYADSGRGCTKPIGHAGKHLAYANPEGTMRIEWSDEAPLLDLLPEENTGPAPLSVGEAKPKSFFKR